MKGSPIGLPFQFVKKVLTGQRTGTHAPSPGAAKKSKVFRARSLQGNDFFLEKGIYKNRLVPTLYIRTARVGNADKSFSENSGKPKKPAAPIYGGWFRVLSGGSRWLSALPTGSRWLSALPTGSK